MNWQEWADAWDSSVWFWPVYLAPFLVALLRRSENLGLIFVINLFIGWTIVGWFLAWALVFLRVRLGNVTPQRASISAAVPPTLS